MIFGMPRPCLTRLDHQLRISMKRKSSRKNLQVVDNLCCVAIIRTHSLFTTFQGIIEKLFS